MYQEKGERLHSKVYVALDGVCNALLNKVSEIAKDDEQLLADIKIVKEEMEQPLSNTFTYKKGEAEPREKHFIGDAAKRLQQRIDQTSDFLDQKFRDWDESRTSEEKAFAEMLGSYHGSDSDVLFQRHMEKCKKEIALVEDRAFKKLKSIEMVSTVRSARRK